MLLRWLRNSKNSKIERKPRGTNRESTAIVKSEVSELVAFVDTSVILRVLFGAPGRINLESGTDKLYASRLLILECSRVIEREVITGRIPDTALP